MRVTHSCWLDHVSLLLDEMEAAGALVLPEDVGGAVRRAMVDGDDEVDAELGVVAEMLADDVGLVRTISVETISSAAEDASEPALEPYCRTFLDCTETALHLVELVAQAEGVGLAQGAARPQRATRPRRRSVAKVSCSPRASAANASTTRVSRWTTPDASPASTLRHRNGRAGLERQLIGNQPRSRRRGSDTRVTSRSEALPTPVGHRLERVAPSTGANGRTRAWTASYSAGTVPVLHRACRLAATTARPLPPRSANRRSSRPARRSRRRRRGGGRRVAPRTRGRQRHDDAGLCHPCESRADGVAVAAPPPEGSGVHGHAVARRGAKRRAARHVDRAGDAHRVPTRPRERPLAPLSRSGTSSFARGTDRAVSS